MKSIKFFLIYCNLNYMIFSVTGLLSDNNRNNFFRKEITRNGFSGNEDEDIDNNNNSNNSFINNRPVYFGNGVVNNTTTDSTAEVYITGSTRKQPSDAADAAAGHINGDNDRYASSKIETPYKSDYDADDAAQNKANFRFNLLGDSKKFHSRQNCEEQTIDDGVYSSTERPLQVYTEIKEINKNSFNRDNNNNDNLYRQNEENNFSSANKFIREKNICDRFKIYSDLVSKLKRYNNLNTDSVDGTADKTAATINADKKYRPNNEEIVIKISDNVIKMLQYLLNYISKSADYSNREKKDIDFDETDGRKLNSYNSVDESDRLPVRYPFASVHEMIDRSPVIDYDKHVFSNENSPNFASNRFQKDGDSGVRHGDDNAVIILSDIKRDVCSTLAKYFDKIVNLTGWKTIYFYFKKYRTICSGYRLTSENTNELIKLIHKFNYVGKRDLDSNKFSEDKSASSPFSMLYYYYSILSKDGTD